MPCADQSEIVELQLDEFDRIQKFCLYKRTCGQTVGGSVLLPYVKRLHTDQILGKSLSLFVKELSEKRILEEFLLMKQYASLQSLLRVWMGLESGGLKEAFVLEEIHVDEQGLCCVAGQVEISIIRDQIRACGGCASCGTSSRT